MQAIVQQMADGVNGRQPYNASVKAWDVIVVGGGIIGLSLSLALRKRGASVLVVERGKPGREASHAAGGMLVDCPLETPAALQPLATASARMYPEFVRELELESGMKVDLRDEGTILFHSHDDAAGRQQFNGSPRLPAQLAELEPSLAASDLPAFHLQERSVDPRALSRAASKAAKNLGVDFSTGDAATGVIITNGQVSGVATARTKFTAPKVVICAGAWSSQIAAHTFPTRPVKGQMLCLIAPSRTFLKHVIRTPDVYLIPRSDGRILVGATVEEAGFDKRTDIATIQRLHQAALKTVPGLSQAKILESWAGLRPGTPDALPIIGVTTTPGLYAATGHFRDGILLAPITAEVMADIIAGRSPEYDLQAFSPARF